MVVDQKAPSDNVLARRARAKKIGPLRSHVSTDRRGRSGLAGSAANGSSGLPSATANLMHADTRFSDVVIVSHQKKSLLYRLKPLYPSAPVGLSNINVALGIDS